MFIGFFYVVLTNSVTFGASSPLASARPGMPLQLGRRPVVIAFALAGIIILICFALVAAMMIVTLCSL